MIIALDYDSTYTTDFGMWDEFIELAERCGNEVIIVTDRPICDLDEDLENLVDTVSVYATGGRAKQACLLQMGITPDIWIDSNPYFILNSGGIV